LEDWVGVEAPGEHATCCGTSGRWTFRRPWKPCAGCRKVLSGVCAEPRRPTWPSPWARAWGGGTEHLARCGGTCAEVAGDGADAAYPPGL